MENFDLRCRIAAETQLASANLDQDQFPHKDLQDRIDSSARKLEREGAILAELEGQMSILAPIPEGSKAPFVASVGVGGFVQSGDPIGVLHL